MKNAKPKKQEAGEPDKLDELDMGILQMLIADAMIPYTDIARKLIISPGTVHVRMKKMQDMGVVTGSQLTVNAAKLGYDICAFIGIFLEKSSEYEEAVQRLKRIPEIVELHYTTGIYSMFAKIVCKDTQDLRVVLNEKIQPIRGISRTETFISLAESIKRNIKITM